jgi:branched-chain amino acid aminotransferase
MDLKVYISGKYYDKEDAKISVFDHGLLYGDGVFEGIRTYGGKPFFLREHVDRLFESAHAIRLEIPLTKEELARVIEETVRLNKIRDGYVRVVVTRGAGYLGLDPRRTSHPQVIVIADHIELYPKEVYEKGLSIVTVSTIRNHPNALSPRIKSLNYLNNILAKIESIDAGAAEALMLNHRGEVAECSGENIFIVRRGVVATPPPEAGILEGITRGVVLRLAREAGYETQERPLVRHDIYVADECFLTGTAAEIVPVVRCDGRLIGSGVPGPVTQELRHRFEALVRQL